MKHVVINSDGTTVETGELEGVNQLPPESEELFWEKLARMEISHYRRARSAAYPDIGDQLDDLFKQGAFSEEMTAKIQAVKDAIPKPVDE